MFDYTMKTQHVDTLMGIFHIHFCLFKYSRFLTGLKTFPMLIHNAHFPLLFTSCSASTLSEPSLLIMAWGLRRAKFNFYHP